MKTVRLLSILCVLLAVFCATGWQELSAKTDDEEPSMIESAKFDPHDPQTGDPVRLKIRFGEPGLRAEIKWFVNGEQVGMSDANAMIPLVEMNQPVKAGDSVEARITPISPSGQAGPTMKVATFYRNAPPEMKLLDQSVSGDKYKARVEAKDPEGGPITLSLTEGPEGMEIDQEGNITWNMGQDASGRFFVKVSAKDDKGRETVLNYSFAVRRVKKN